MIRHKLALHIADKELMGCELPWYWGFAYRKFDIRYSVFYPVFLNLVVRYSLKLFWYVYSWVRAGGWEDRLDDAYWMGFNDGTTRKGQDLEELVKIILGINKEG